MNGGGVLLGKKDFSADRRPDRRPGQGQGSAAGGRRRPARGPGEIQPGECRPDFSSGTSREVARDEDRPVCAGLPPGDAIGDDAAHLSDFFRSQGFHSEIYWLNRDRELEGESRALSEFPPPRPTGYHDPPLRPAFAPDPGLSRLRSKKASSTTISHRPNSSPPLAKNGPHLPGWAGRSCGSGRDVDMALADSEFNARELVELGFGRSPGLSALCGFCQIRTACRRRSSDDLSGTAGPTSSLSAGSPPTRRSRTSSESLSTTRNSSLRSSGSSSSARRAPSRLLP